MENEASQRQVSDRYDKPCIAELADVLEEAGIGSEVELAVVRDKRARTVELRVMDIS